MRQATFVQAACVAATVAGLASFARAQTSTQCPVRSAGGPGTIVGTVSDTAHFPMDSVDVYITSPRRQSTSVNGTFRFDKLDPGQYTITARRLGYLQQVRRVILGDSGAAVAFCLVPGARTLAPVITAAPRGGLSGVIADTAFGIITGANISVLGSNKRAVSDSAGIFFVPLKAGKYMVRVKRQGFETKMVSVSVPSDSGRKMLIWLAPSRRGATAREEWNAHELSLRLDTASAARSRVFTREDINNFGATELRQLAQAGGAIGYVSDDCNAIVDGTYAVPMWTLKSEDLEMVEVYINKPARTAPTRIQNQRRQTTTTPVCPRVFAWLRK